MKKREGYWKGSVITCTEDDFEWDLQTILLPPLLNFAKLRCWRLISLKCNDFKKLMRCTCLRRHDAHVHAVWCLWCKLVQLGYPYDELMVARAITVREGIWVVSRFPTIKIASALLVAVVWLQHTWCPRFRHGTSGYGTTTSPRKESGYEYGVFMRMYISIPMVSNAYAMQCMPKSGINFISQSREQGQKK
jgi:hypothetical protein